jgi:hypothetical protein
MYAVLKSNNGTEFCSCQLSSWIALFVFSNGVSDTAPAHDVNPTLSSGQIQDIHSIANGITAIKRHQTTISSELSELKRSNQLLWQDALAAQGRQQKQRDTIYRIINFLAGGIWTACEYRGREFPWGCGWAAWEGRWY